MRYNMRNQLLSIIALTIAALMLPGAQARAQQYTKKDSVKVVTLLDEARQQPADTNWMLYFARQLTGIPYVAKTLEVNSEEQLIVNLRQLDCTTYVETVTALALCMKHEQYDFSDYCRYLRLLRYRKGEVSYVNRLHYFTSWIADKTCMGFVVEPNKPKEAFTATQTLRINYMSTHVRQYPMLVGHPDWVEPTSPRARLPTQKCSGMLFRTATSLLSAPAKRASTPRISASPCGMSTACTCSTRRKFTRKPSKNR